MMSDDSFDDDEWDDTQPSRPRKAPSQEPESGDYDVGYGKPPKASRFKPGQSGNPRGRPKVAKRVDTLADLLLNRTVNITENGRVQQVPYYHAIRLALLAKILRGDVRAVKALIALEPIVGPLQDVNEAAELHQATLREVPDEELQTMEDILRRGQMKALAKRGQAG